MSRFTFLRTEWNRWRDRLSLRERALLARRIAFLVRAGTPLAQAVEILRNQSDIPALRRALEVIGRDLNQGLFLWRSLERLSTVFDSFAISIVRIGEESGTLDQNLTYLADELDKQHTLTKKVWGALVYPLFIIVATIGMTVMLMWYIFPKILPIFSGLDVELPLTTRVLIGINQVIGQYGWFILLSMIVMITGGILARRRPLVRWAMHRSLLRIPLIGRLARQYALASVCRTLSTLLRSSTPIVQACRVTSDTTHNLIYRQALSDIADEINTGEKIGHSLARRSELFPTLMTQLVSIGDLTGNLDQTLGYISQLYESEVDETVKGISTIIEPLLMVGMGCVVGFVAISIITPIYEITQHIRP